MNSEIEQKTEFDEEISKSQIKRDADMLVDLGKSISQLSADQFDAMPLVEPLRQALREARKLSKGGAIKRQFKYIGKLLRDTDVEPINNALERLLDKDRAAAARLHLLEQWRDRLVAEGDEALGELIKEYPQVDRQHVRQLQRTAKLESQREKPPAAARKLFQYLRSLLVSTP